MSQKGDLGEIVGDYIGADGEMFGFRAPRSSTKAVRFSAQQKKCSHPIV
jgi:hypothetical protein